MATESISVIPKAQYALAYVNWIVEWKWLEAEQGFRKAIALDPQFANHV